MSMETINTITQEVWTTGLKKTHPNILQLIEQMQNVEH